jgi:hypothetical protein
VFRYLRNRAFALAVIELTYVFQRSRARFPHDWLTAAWSGQPDIGSESPGPILTAVKNRT